jgi:hypothetical protein
VHRTLFAAKDLVTMDWAAEGTGIPIIATPTGVFHEQDRNYLAGTHPAGRSIFTGD